MVCNIAAARAVDREFNYKFGSDLGAGEAGGLRPPAPPCFPRSSAPRTPKRRSTPSAAAVGRSLSTEPLVQGQLRCLGQILFSKNIFWVRSNLSRADSLPGAVLFSRSVTFLWKKPLAREILGKKPLVLGSFAAWGRTLFRNFMFGKKPLVRGSFAACGRTFPEM